MAQQVLRLYCHFLSSLGYGDDLIVVVANDDDVGRDDLARVGKDNRGLIERIEAYATSFHE